MFVDQDALNRSLSVVGCYWNAVLDGAPHIVAYQSHAPLSDTLLYKNFRQDAGDARVVEVVYSGDAFQPFIRALLAPVIDYARAHPDEIDAMLSTVFYRYQDTFKALLLEQSVPAFYEDVPEECAHDQQHVFEAVCALFSYISKSEPVIIVMNQLHLAPVYIWQWVHFALEYQWHGRVLVLIQLDDHYQVDDHRIEYWEAMLGSLDIGSLPYVGGELPSVVANRNAPAPTPQKMLEHCQLMLAFLAFEDCRHLAMQLQRQHFYQFEIEEKLDLLHILGDVSWFCDEFDAALISYNNLYNLVQKYGSDADISDVCRKLSLTELKRNNHEMAENFANLSTKLALKTGVDHCILRAYLALFAVSVGKTQPMGKNAYQTLRSLMEQYANIQQQAYFYRNSIVLFPYKLSLDEVRADVESSIELSRSVKDWFAIAQGYHNKGIVYSFMGKTHLSLRCYKVSRDLYERVGNPLGIIRLANSIGYAHMLEGNYRQSIEYYGQALRKLSDTHDFIEINTTLFNFTWVYFCARHYDKAAETISIISQIMRLLNIESIPFQPLFNIYALKGICHAKCGQQARAMETLNQLQWMNTPDEPTAQFLYLMLSAMCAEIEKEEDQANNFYTQAGTALEHGPKNLIRFLPVYYFEYGRFLHQHGRNDEALRIVKQGLTLGDHLPLGVYKKWLTDARYRKAYYPMPLPLPDMDIRVRHMVTLARQAVSLNQLHCKIRDIDFLNNLQEIINTSHTRRSLIKSVMALIDTHFRVDVVASHIYEKGRWNQVHVDATIDMPLLDWNQALIQLTKTKHPLLMCCDSDFYAYPDAVASSFSSLVNLPIVNDGKLVANLLFATGPDGRRLGQSEFSVLQIVAGQVAIALSKAEREEQFVTLSLTDQLTGLYNRQAFDERLQHEIARFRRYQYRQENHLTCVRVDILSFKHFNQKFGYQVGDVILQLFAELLKSCVREVDYIVRLYANEFMMVLPETDEQGAGIVAGRIREKMLDANSFDTSIEAVLGQAIILDEQYQLDCALGIVEFPQESSNENELVEMLAKAEQVLERAKKCSDRMALWSDMNKPLPPVEQSELA